MNMGGKSKRRNSKRRKTFKISKRRNTNYRNTKRINTKRINTKRRNTKRRNINNRVKNKSKFINGYKIIKCLNPHKNPHKKSFKYGGSCEEIVRDGITCIKRDGRDVLLGKGAYGSVYLVEKGGVNYAMKIIAFVRNGKQIFENEVYLLKQVNGISNIVQSIKSWKTKNSGIIIMNYLGDTSLNGLRKKVYSDKIILTENEIWKYITQLAITLNELHKRNLFHNDIKDDNIMIYSNNAYLIDLGLMTEGKSKCSGSRHFTPHNKAICKQNPSRACNSDICPKQHDIYALAMIMFDFIYYTARQSDPKIYLIRLLERRREEYNSVYRNDLIKELLKRDKEYNVSDEYKQFIIDIIDGNINTPGDILLNLPEDILLNLPKDVLLQLGVIYLSELYDNIDRPEASSIINRLKSIIIDDNASRALLIADKEKLVKEIRGSEEGLESKLYKIRVIEQQLNDLSYLEKILRAFLKKKEHGTDTDIVKSKLKRIILMLELEEDDEEAPVIEGVEAPVIEAPVIEAPVIEGVEDEEEVED